MGHPGPLLLLRCLQPLGVLWLSEIAGQLKNTINSLRCAAAPTLFPESLDSTLNSPRLEHLVEGDLFAFAGDHGMDVCGIGSVPKPQSHKLQLRPGPRCHRRGRGVIPWIRVRWNAPTRPSTKASKRGGTPVPTWMFGMVYPLGCIAGRCSILEAYAVHSKCT